MKKGLELGSTAPFITACGHSRIPRPFWQSANTFFIASAGAPPNDSYCSAHGSRDWVYPPPPPTFWYNAMSWSLRTMQSNVVMQQGAARWRPALQQPFCPPCHFPVLYCDVLLNHFPQYLKDDCICSSCTWSQASLRSSAIYKQNIGSPSPKTV